ncbi:acyltransferase [Clostridiaceae bacterium]|nr:acyltransferase [Clostridiaceae bacterium]
MEETRRSLPAVQGLRAIALLAIVIYHCGNPALYQAGVWGAGVFFILSGYLRGCACESCGYTPSKTIRPLLSFTAARLKKLYPLHIIMLIISIPVSDMPASLQADGASKLPFWGVVMLMNITLTKSFYPDYYFSFNGVTWFLSSYMALLFLTLPLQYLMARLLKSDTARLLFAGSLYLFHAGFCLFISRVTSNVMYWTYIFPLAHLPGYVLGMAAGRSLTIRRKAPACLLQLASLAILIPLVCFTRLPEWTYGSLAFTLPVIMLILSANVEGTPLYFLLSRRALVFLGDLSPFIFLIHQVVYTCCTRLGFVPDTLPKRVLAVVFDLLVSAALSQIYRACIIRYRHCRK